GARRAVGVRIANGARVLEKRANRDLRGGSADERRRPRRDRYARVVAVGAIVRALTGLVERRRSGEDVLADVDQRPGPDEVLEGDHRRVVSEEPVDAIDARSRVRLRVFARPRAGRRGIVRVGVADRLALGLAIGRAGEAAGRRDLALGLRLRGAEARDVGKRSGALGGTA